MRLPTTAAGVASDSGCQRSAVPARRGWREPAASAAAAARKEVRAQRPPAHPCGASLPAAMAAACARILAAALLHTAESRKQKGKSTDDTDKGFSLAHLMFVVLCVGFLSGAVAAATAMRWLQRDRTQSPPKQDEAKHERTERQEPRAAERDEGVRRRGAQPREQPGLPRELRHRGFEARFASVCAECDEHYEKGTAIVNGPAGWVHLTCEAASLERVARQAAPTRKTRNVVVQSPCSFTKNFTRMTPLGDREQGAWAD